MKKVLCLILLLVFLLSMSACTIAPEWKPYTGTMDGYIYYHQTPRELAWEQDILSLANTFMTEHPLLLNENFPMRYFAIQGFSMTRANLYNEELYTAFLKSINDLIPRLSELSDEQIPYELQKIVAGLGDAHSQVLLESKYYFPMLAEPFFVDGKAELRMVVLPEQHKDLIYAKLISINDIELGQVIDRLKPYGSVENEYGLISRLTDTHLGEMLLHPGILTAAGIMESETATVTFVLETADGNQHPLSISPVTDVQFQNTKLEGQSIYMAYPYTFKDCFTDLYWYELWPEENTAYVRINSFQEEEDESLKQMSEALMADLRANEQIEKIIVDLRHNYGGLSWMEGFPRLMQALRLPQIADVCVLIDHNSMSRSVTAAFEIRKEVATATLIGTPAGEGSFLIGLQDSDRTLPNSGLEYIIGTEACDMNREQPFDALMPDLIVYPTLEDYQNGIDTILEAARRK